MERTLRQMLKLIQTYETDEVILGLAGEQANQWQRFGVDPDLDTLLSQDLTLQVDVGMGNTDPVKKVERLIYGLKATTELVPENIKRMKSDQITNERGQQ